MIEFVTTAAILSLFSIGGIPYLLLTLAFFILGIIIGVLLSFFKLFKCVSSLYPSAKKEKKHKNTRTDAKPNNSEETLQPNKLPSNSSSHHELQWNGEHFEQGNGSPPQNNPVIPLQEQGNLIENNNFQKGSDMQTDCPDTLQNSTPINNNQPNNPDRQATENSTEEAQKQNNMYYSRRNWYYYRY